MSNVEGGSVRIMKYYEYDFNRKVISSYHKMLSAATGRLFQA